MGNTEIAKWKGDEIYTREGDLLGTIAEILMHQNTLKPTWFEVETDASADDVAFVPFAGASADDGRVEVPYSAEQVGGAARARTWEDLTDAQRDSLYDHYDVPRPD